MLSAFLLSFGVIFVAELGDKSQLMAMTFATRYKPVPILVGITIATALVHGFSVLLGAAIGSRIPTDAVTIVAGVAFLCFAAWTWRGDSLDDDEVSKADRTTRSAVVAASAAFFLAELGDKTMFATIALSTNHGLFGTWLGSTVGMVAADALAILVGAVMGARLPETAIRIGATIAFLLFGIVLIVQGFVG